MGNLVYALIALAGLVFGIVGMVSGNKRKPAVSEELYRDYVPRGEFVKVIGELSTLVQKHGDSHADFVFREELDRSINRIHERMDELHAHVGKGFKDVERAIGRLEGKVEDQRS